jgi:hypothetical protein
MASICCPICCDETTDTHTLTCPKCSFEVCHTCIVKATISAGKADITCMSCKNTWDRIFIFKSLPSSIVYGPLKSHRENALFEQEKLKLVETQPLVQMINKRIQYEKENDDLMKEFKNIRYDDDTDTRFFELFMKKQNILNKIYEAVAQERVIRDQLEYGLYDVPDAVVQPPVIICQCPAPECRGFILKDHKYTCGICASKICKKCHVLIDDNTHACKQEDVESVAHIKKNCKHCPGCGALSRKTEGCSQVWCRVCHKAWNWNTGIIETGKIHATDYYNFMRQEGREIPRNAEMCGDDQDIEYIFSRIENMLKNDVKDYIFFRFQIMDEYDFRMNDTLNQQSNLDLRIKYLMNEISEAKFKQLLHKRDKEYVFKREIHAMRCAYTVTIREALIQLGQSNSEKDIQKNIKTIKNFQDVMEKQYVELARVFKSKRMCPFRHRNETPLRA